MYALREGAKGRIYGGGHLRPGKYIKGWIFGADRYGNLQWQTAISGGSHRISEGLVPLGKDGLVAVGHGWFGNDTRGLLVRADAWGRTSCAAAGKCADKAAGACDDNKPCTRDWCDASGKCKHSNDDSLTCIRDDGCSSLGTCKSGSCSAAVRGRLFAQAQTFAGGTTTHAQTAVMADGKVLATGQTYYGGRHRAWSTLYDAQGNRVFNDHMALNNRTTWGAGIAPIAGGGRVRLWRTRPDWRYGTLTYRDAATSSAGSSTTASARKSGRSGCFRSRTAAWASWCSGPPARATTCACANTPTARPRC